MITKIIKPDHRVFCPFFSSQGPMFVNPFTSSEFKGKSLRGRCVSSGSLRDVGSLGPVPDTRPHVSWMNWHFVKKTVFCIIIGLFLCKILCLRVLTRRRVS